MERITPGIEHLIERTEQVLSEHGRLSTALSGFTPRMSQRHLAKAIADTLLKRTTLIAEAGTGTGKTFAYLIPCLLSGQKTLITTATKTLQDQLFHKDLPALVQALGLSIQLQNLKGRANYLCRYRIELHAESGCFSHPQSHQDLMYIREKLPQLTSGERSELPEIEEDSPVWPYATSSVDNCLGGECPYHQTCFLVKARKRALEADIVVINHHLYFADAKLKETGFGALLPGAEAVIFDEAHQLSEIASNFYGERFSTRQLSDLMEDMLKEWPVLDLANQPLKSLHMQLTQWLDRLWLADAQGEARKDWTELAANKRFQSAWQEILGLIKSWLACFDEVEFEDRPGLERSKIRLEHFYELMNTFSEKSGSYIVWVERFKQALVFHQTPLDVSNVFQAELKRHPCAYIFTSATLSVGSSFDSFVRGLGLMEANTLTVPSPFDFKSQALLYLPRNMPDPKQEHYYNILLQKAVPVIKACRGRCFFLFTSHRALRHMADMLPAHLDYPLLIQGEEAKSILLSRFRTLGNAVLLGTATFWEGVDVKGDALSCVIIDKLPFASPADPVIRGRMNHLKSQGLSGFDELTLPNAILALKQGIGRLIRDAADYGLLMIADPRLPARAYGGLIFQSLPDMHKTRHEARALEFIKTFDALAEKNHEPIGH